HAVDPGAGVVRAGVGDDPLVGLPHRLRGVQPDRHAAGVGLVQDVGGDDLGGHGQAELDGGGDGLVGGGRQRLAGDRDAVGRGEGPALGGGGRGAVRGAGPVQDRAGRVPIVAGCAGGGGGVLGGGHRSDHSVRCEVGELVVGQAQLAAVDLGVVLAQQGGAAHVGGGFGEPDRQADGGVGAA